MLFSIGYISIRRVPLQKGTRSMQKSRTGSTPAWTGRSAREELLLGAEIYGCAGWEAVLEPLSGYLILAQALYEQGSAFASGWNFGPRDEDNRAVQEVAVFSDGFRSKQN